MMNDRLPYTIKGTQDYIRNGIIECACKVTKVIDMDA